jgi:hypothetical protein
MRYDMKKKNVKTTPAFQQAVKEVKLNTPGYLSLVKTLSGLKTAKFC